MALRGLVFVRGCSEEGIRKAVFVKELEDVSTAQRHGVEELWTYRFAAESLRIKTCGVVSGEPEMEGIELDIPVVLRIAQEGKERTA